MSELTRLEQFYSAILSGDTSVLPEPVTREEQYLYSIAVNGGGGGGGGSDVNVIDSPTAEEIAASVAEIWGE